MTTANLIEIFCILDEFCKYFTPELKSHDTYQVPVINRNYFTVSIFYTHSFSTEELNCTIKSAKFAP